MVRSVAGLQIERVWQRWIEIRRAVESARPQEKVRGSNPLSSTTLSSTNYVVESDTLSSTNVMSRDVGDT
jgi:hypothetical protein